MLTDFLVALVSVVIAVLGIIVHPLLWLVIVGVLWLVGCRRAGSRR